MGLSIARFGRIVVVLAVVLVVAREGAAAPPGFAFLEIPAGARASALGGAGATLGAGAEAAFWNPAGLAPTRALEVTGGHAELFERLRNDHFAFAAPLAGGAWSASLRALYSEPIEERDELGNLIGSFGAHDLEFGLGYGRTVHPGLALGGSLHVLRERIANLGATAYGFGFGTTWAPAALAGLTLGLDAQNLGPAARYTIDGVKGEPVSQPSALQAGAAYGIALGRTKVTGAVEGRFTRGRAGIGVVAADFATPLGASLRAGLRVNDTATNVSFGAGYTLARVRLDYAFIPLRLDLGDSHRFSFTAHF